MLGLRWKIVDETAKAKRKVQEANFRSLGHAAGAIRLTARRSIRVRKDPSPPGKPPSSATRRLREGILFAVEKEIQTAVIGASYEAVGPSGSAHEFGGWFRGTLYPARPFMGPALESNRKRLPSHWYSSVKE